MKIPEQESRMAERFKEVAIIIIIILGLCVGAYVIAGLMGEDREVYNSTEFAREYVGRVRAGNEPNESIEQIWEISDHQNALPWQPPPEPNEPKKYECERCGGATNTESIFMVHNCISTTQQDEEGNNTTELEVQIAERDYRAMHEAELMEETKLISLDDWNNQQLGVQMKANQPTKNGIACPECGKELYDTIICIAYSTNPIQYPIHCECGWTGARY